MSWNFLTPQVEGDAARQAHADIPENSFEREIGRDGFYGAATHMYHRNPADRVDQREGPIWPRAFNPALVATTTDVAVGRAWRCWATGISRCGIGGP